MYVFMYVFALVLELIKGIYSIYRYVRMLRAVVATHALEELVLETDVAAHATHGVYAFHGF